MARTHSLSRRGSAPMAQSFTTGGDCDAWCTKCRMDLGHTVVAMVGREPVQVKCNTCGSFHKYRKPKGVKAPLPPGASTPRASRSRSSSSPRGTKKVSETRFNQVEASAGAARARWQEQVAPRLKDAPQLVVYQVRGTYEAGTLLDHRKFGVGLVLQAVDSKRIRVLFKDAERDLATRPL